MNSIMSIFSPIPAIQEIFKLGFMPQDDELFELTCEQYQAYYDSAEEDDEINPDEKVYMLLPKDTQKYGEFASGDVFTLTESDIMLFKRAEAIIESYCKKSGKTFNNFEEKLFYAASQMPDLFSEGTKYAKTTLSSKENSE